MCCKYSTSNSIVLIKSLNSQKFSVKLLGFVHLLQLNVAKMQHLLTRNQTFHIYIKCPVDALMLAWVIDHTVLCLSCNMGHLSFALYACTQAVRCAYEAIPEYSCCSYYMYIPTTHTKCNLPLNVFILFKVVVSV